MKKEFKKLLNELRMHSEKVGYASGMLLEIAAHETELADYWNGEITREQVKVQQLLETINNFIDESIA